MVPNNEKDYDALTFHLEACRRHQHRRFEAFSDENEMTLGNILSALLPDDLPKIERATVIISDENREFYYSKIDFGLDAYNPDIFYLMYDLDDNGEWHEIPNANVTVSFCVPGVFSGVLLFRLVQSLRDMAYIRMNACLNFLEEEDDMKTLNSASAPYVVSALLLYEKGNCDEFLYYYNEAQDEVDKAACAGNLDFDDDFHNSIVDGIRGFRSIADLTALAGKQLVAHRYHDASYNLNLLMKQYKKLLFEHPDLKETVAIAAFEMAECFSKLGEVEMTDYYLRIAYDLDCHDLEKLMEDFCFPERVPVPGSLTLGYLLHTFFSLKKDNMTKMAFVDNGEPHFYSGDKDFWYLGLEKILHDDVTVVLPFSWHHDDVENVTDGSVYDRYNSLVIRSEAVGNGFLRVTAFMPDPIHNNMDKKEGAKVCSFIFNPDIKGSDVDSTFEETKALAENFERNNCILQALYERESTFVLAEADTDDYYEAAYHTAYLYDEFRMYEKSLYFLNISIKKGDVDYFVEYINALTHSEDVRALDEINRLIGIVYDNRDGDLNFFYQFLLRRKAYVLTDLKLYDEAVDMLLELRKNPGTREYVDNELKYIIDLRKEEEEE